MHCKQVAEIPLSEFVSMGFSILNIQWRPLRRRRRFYSHPLHTIVCTQHAFSCSIPCASLHRNRNLRAYFTIFLRARKTPRRGSESHKSCPFSRVEATNHEAIQVGRQHAAAITDCRLTGATQMCLSSLIFKSSTALDCIDGKGRLSVMFAGQKMGGVASMAHKESRVKMRPSADLLELFKLRSIRCVVDL